MGNINKVAAVGVVFFSVMLAGFVGMKVDQTTVALLGGAFIGLVVAIPTTALIMMAGTRKPKAPDNPEPPQYRVELWKQRPDFHNDFSRVIKVYDFSADGWEWWDLRDYVSNDLHCAPSVAEDYMKKGLVRFVPRQLTPAKGDYKIVKK